MNTASSPPGAVGTVLAVGAHPDDIEFRVAGTMLLLADLGWELHYLTIADGSCGSTLLPPAQIADVRRHEAQHAAAALGATWHEPLTQDLAILYTEDLVQRVTAVVRDVAPDIVLAPSPQDYMEDHTTTSRLTVTATFMRAVPNFCSRPSRPAVMGNVTVYHAQPVAQRDQLRRFVRPGAYVDVTSVYERKRQALLAHKSQDAFLEHHQGPSAYLARMDAESRQLGALAGFEHAEGLRRHLHVAMSQHDDDPLEHILGARYQVDEEYERALTASSRINTKKPLSR